jgi:hypothetical protein
MAQHHNWQKTLKANFLPNMAQHHNWHKTPEANFLPNMAQHGTTSTVCQTWQGHAKVILLPKSAPAERLLPKMTGSATYSFCRKWQ